MKNLPEIMNNYSVIEQPFILHRVPRFVKKKIEEFGKGKEYAFENRDSTLDS